MAVCSKAQINNHQTLNMLWECDSVYLAAILHLSSRLFSLFGLDWTEREKVDLSCVFKRLFCMMIIWVTYISWSIFVFTPVWTHKVYTLSLSDKEDCVCSECALGYKLFVINAFAICISLCSAWASYCFLSSASRVFFSFISVWLWFYSWQFVTLCFPCVALILLRLFSPAHLFSV